MGAISSGLKDVSAASGLPCQKQRRWYSGDWDLVQGSVYVCKDLDLNDWAWGLESKFAGICPSFTLAEALDLAGQQVMQGYYQSASAPRLLPL